MGKVDYVVVSYAIPTKQLACLREKGKNEEWKRKVNDEARGEGGGCLENNRGKARQQWGMPDGDREILQEGGEQEGRVDKSGGDERRESGGESPGQPATTSKPATSSADKEADDKGIKWGKGGGNVPECVRMAEGAWRRG